MFVFLFDNNDNDEDVIEADDDEALLACWEFDGLGVLIDSYENFAILDSGLPPLGGD